MPRRQQPEERLGPFFKGATGNLGSQGHLRLSELVSMVPEGARGWAGRAERRTVLPGVTLIVTVNLGGSKVIKRKGHTDLAGLERTPESPAPSGQGRRSLGRRNCP